MVWSVRFISKTVMFATIRALQCLVSGPNDLPAGEGTWGGPVGSGDDWALWGDYSGVDSRQRDPRGSLCAPEVDDDNDCSPTFIGYV